ncbi:MAG: hypothetical protein G01um101477_241 [Candidatus Doudnabacteria bacterium Gr01-1014_77]|uniref:Uncharacterized protein n=1 Tax=Candidatus Doudnabacteria bacterium Gr01-1014_77 TaxID=2017133 RepID=A0A554JCE5_9BACT|nr:MAG: hypothetical protein G01um101477_241 [Candidatus Doudnabacteria bacterium Gr01-1014_77]
MKRAIFLILLLTIIVVAGIYFISKIKTKPKQQTVSEQFPSGEGVFPLLAASFPVDKKVDAVTQQPAASTVGVETNRTTEQPKGSGTTPVPAETKETPSMKACGVSGLRFSISVPVAWVCNLEERNGNALVFYLDSKEIGSIEVFLGTNQSYESLKQEVFASLENSLIIEKDLFGTKVFSFDNLKYAKSVAFVHSGNTYYFRNSLIDRSSEFVFKLF